MNFEKLRTQLSLMKEKVRPGVFRTIYTRDMCQVLTMDHCYVPKSAQVS